MSMRKQLVETVEGILAKDQNAVVLLGDIGVFGFRQAFEKWPTRIYNIGILEQSMIGMSAGLAMSGFTPIVHTIAPFLVERAYEQLKDDFGYQHLGGNFISVGASYDYAALGCTHHCPGDVGILKQIPGMEIVVPGTAAEFDRLFVQSYADGHPTYYRLSERENDTGYEVNFGSSVVVKTGAAATVIAIGPMLKAVMQAVSDLDVTVLYYTTVAPFDIETLKQHATNGKVLLCEPYYAGGLAYEIMEALKPNPIRLEFVGLPRVFFTKYGKAEEHDVHWGVAKEDIRKKILEMI